MVTGEYFCENIYNLEIQAIQEVRGCISELQSGKTAAYEQLMYALLLSGLAMQMIGNSRPASGAEHHISHLIEMEVVNPHVDAYHGEKVGVGLLIAASVYHRMAKALKAGQFFFKNLCGLGDGFAPKELCKRRNVCGDDSGEHARSACPNNGRNLAGKSRENSGYFAGDSVL